ncbi:unnamed protein product [Protopolystoma xenopodis]|uniref:NPHP4 Ig-like domain-containing protein n=1 Tax=Protopolystoma xenopodis TaxID=117903 RepID=A0A3S5B4K3_9PLAT|nr:unnamed protein product [Protopolystoma xenopodis]
MNFTFQLDGSNWSKQLGLINNYRERVKKEHIALLLRGASILEHVLNTSFGASEFFEYQLKNPYNREVTISISIDDET